MSCSYLINYTKQNTLYRTINILLEKALNSKIIPYNVLIYITVRTKYSVRMYIIIDRYIFYVMFLFN